MSSRLTRLALVCVAVVSASATRPEQAAAQHTDADAWCMECHEYLGLFGIAHYLGGVGDNMYDCYDPPGCHWWDELGWCYEQHSVGSCGEGDFALAAEVRRTVFLAEALGNPSMVHALVADNSAVQFDAKRGRLLVRGCNGTIVEAITLPSIYIPQNPFVRPAAVNGDLRS